MVQFIPIVHNNGFQKQDFHGALPAINCEDLKYVPSIRVENACATGSAAINTAINSIDAKNVNGESDIIKYFLCNFDLDQILNK